MFTYYALKLVWLIGYKLEGLTNNTVSSNNLLGAFNGLLYLNARFWIYVRFCSIGYMLNVACPYGFLGTDCADRCNDTCNGCNRFNCSCDSGCKPGWHGYDCSNGNVRFWFLWKKNAYCMNLYDVLFSSFAFVDLKRMV